MEVNANFDTTDTEIAKPRLISNSPAVGATTTCDLSLARYFKFTVSQATTLAFTNVPAVGSVNFVTRIRLLITNGSAFVITWPASVTWLGAGMSPKFKASGVDEVEMVTPDGGTTWYASFRTSRPGVLFQTTGQTTTSTSDASLVSYQMPANTLTASNHMLRITMWGNCITQAATPNVLFGGTLVDSAAVTAGESYFLDIMLVRTGSATEIVESRAYHGSTFQGSQRVAPTVDLTAVVTIDFRGAVTAGGTLRLDFAVVELVASP